MTLLKINWIKTEKMLQGGDTRLKLLNVTKKCFIKILTSDKQNELLKRKHVVNLVIKTSSLFIKSIFM